jgi:hypothetical protein
MDTSIITLTIEDPEMPSTYRSFSARTMTESAVAFMRKPVTYM